MKAPNFLTFIGVFSLLASINSHGVVVLSTDFTNTGVSGATLQGVSWTENGLSAPTDLTASSNMFTSGAAAATNGYFSVNQNINGSTELAPAWDTTWTITVGVADILLDDIVLTSLEHNSSGILGGGNGTTNIKLIIVDNNTTNEIANITNTKTISDGTGEDLTYDFGSPLTLTSGNTYDITFELWENSSSGNFEAFDQIVFNGNAVPEPSAFALSVMGLGICFIRRRK